MLFVGLFVAVTIVLSQIDLEILRKDLIVVLNNATGLPISVDGKISWKFSLKPKVELSKVRIKNAEWAQEEYGASAEKVEVTLDLLSLLLDKPTVQKLKIYNVDLNIEENEAGEKSIVSAKKEKDVPENDNAENKIRKYPFNLNMGLGEIEVSKMNTKIGGSNYYLNAFAIEHKKLDESQEFVGWFRSGNRIYPFVLTFSELNTERKVYPVRLAIASDGVNALVANVALEQTSKMPIDFIVKGSVPDLDRLGEIVGADIAKLPVMDVDITGGMNHNKISFRNSKINIKSTEVKFSGDYDWSGDKNIANIKINSKRFDLPEIFPNGFFEEETKSIRPNRPLNAFKNTPLYGEMLNKYDLNLTADFNNLILYRGLNVENIDVDVNLKDSKMNAVVSASIAGGTTKTVANVHADADGAIYAQAAGRGENIIVGNLLDELYEYDYISGLPTAYEFYFEADGQNLEQLMSSITGPIDVYSMSGGYINSNMVGHIYGEDFITALRHDIQDMFTSNDKYDNFVINCASIKLKLRNGFVETKNGVAIETNAVNFRLEGMADLGQEFVDVSFVSLPVRGLKLSLSGNVGNMIEIKGNLSEPDIQISGEAIANKVMSATSLGLILAPFTGGIGLVAGAGVGFFAGDVLESWLGDDNPCQTVKEKGAPAQDGDPDWLNAPIPVLIEPFMK